MPIILHENENVLKIYQIVKNQYIMGFNGPVDINVMAVDAIINRYNIKEKNCFDRVVNICRYMLNKSLNKQKNNSSIKNKNKNKTFN